jgi:PleD family two-component response regulator
MCREVEEYAWQSVHPNLQKISVSIGLAGNHGKASPEDMLAEADKQLYCAKKHGKNRVCVDEDEMDASPSI